ncbi:hypothetical protein EDD37DRAFT_147296 [Exophiala viscosa]|uniref:N-acetyltransferase domain-containing protein n=1 Tax=Exophiala viscosa TaxID=2486360 RepID=A0AAN6DNV2_9EURO|nr:hypothetical protein EDD36DRAFT_63134 [Exophiala viscosa]KAI1621154.1 hypothetical protein EDD37DRAFT_147296 [Exophiala viscosa]
MDSSTSTGPPTTTSGQESGVTFRAAKLEEDDVLSRILCNAFLPVWNHNWFQGISEPLQPVEIGRINGPTPKMSNLQKSRVMFYRTVIRLTRLVGGEAWVAEVPSSESDGAPTDVGAIVLWLPPRKRLADHDVFTLWRSGILNLTLPWHYGFTGLYRIQFVFEANVASMIAKNLPEGFQMVECGFPQIIARNPKYPGKGYASQLFKHILDRHFEEYPGTPVLLDTSTDQGVRAYERLGFKLIDQVPVETDTDETGIRLTKAVTAGAKQRIRDTCVQRVMVKMP